MQPTSIRRRSFRISGLPGRRVPRKATSVNREKGRPSSRRSRQGWRRAGRVRAVTRPRLPQRRLEEVQPLRAAPGRKQVATDEDRTSCSASRPTVSCGRSFRIQAIWRSASEFLPANSTANGLIWTDGAVYAATSNTSVAPRSRGALDYTADYACHGVGNRWCACRRYSLGTDGPSTPPPAAEVAVCEFDRCARGQTLKVMTDNDERGLVRFDACRLHRSDRTSSVPQQTDASISWTRRRLAAPIIRHHWSRIRRPIRRTCVSQMTAFQLARWWGNSLDPRGDRRRNYRLQAYARREHSNAPTAWTSPTMVRPRAAIVVNGVIFALGGGHSGANAVLYALDSTTGKHCGAVAQS